MAVEISGLPNPSNIESYSAVENATPLDPGSNSGGFGQITWVSETWDRARLIRGTDIVLSDGVMGRTTGIVRDVTGNIVSASFTADSELGKLNVERYAEPYSGTLSGLLQYYLDLCGIFAPLDMQVADFPINAPGFSGNVWDHVKWLMSAHQIEMALVFDKVVVRPIRQFEAYTGRVTDYNFAANSQTAALAVDVNYYNHRKITKGEVYPVPGEEPSIPSVEAGEIIEVEVSLNASLSRVYQPKHVHQVGPENQSGTEGVYTVVGNDNLPITPAQWADFGGRLDVFIGEDSRSLLIRITGAHISHLSPFRIAMSAGGTDYNSLHITGDGVAWDIRTVRLYTGADPLTVSEQIGTTVDNPFISTPEQAMQAGQHTAAAYSGSTVQISGQAVSINRETSDKRPVAVQLRDVDVKHYEADLRTIADFNAYYGDETLQQWSERWEDLFVDMFDNQVFGNVSGARVYADGAYYRIVDATVTPEAIDYNATLDTTIGDFNKVWRGGTVQEFNELFAEHSLKQFSMMPLWKGD